ncbi:3412_t:CDS:1 [Acaulospora morrowiae]|uniref:3412_t:CDS:1 n=1 Tax=Acaulospora morrowiae TaxID=94023 RepID=A0A9N8VQH5_9GLOM|nr:3412_t:CDS:1 [Acaulospora morrowiae]
MSKKTPERKNAKRKKQKKPYKGTTSFIEFRKFFNEQIRTIASNIPPIEICLNGKKEIISLTIIETHSSGWISKIWNALSNDHFIRQHFAQQAEEIKNKGKTTQQTGFCFTSNQTINKEYIDEWAIQTARDQIINNPLCFVPTPILSCLQKEEDKKMLKDDIIRRIKAIDPRNPITSLHHDLHHEPHHDSLFRCRHYPECIKNDQCIIKTMNELFLKGLYPL